MKYPYPIKNWKTAKEYPSPTKMNGGAVNRTSREILLNIRFVTWRPAVALTWESLWAIAGSLSDVWIKTDESGNR